MIPLPPLAASFRRDRNLETQGLVWLVVSAATLYPVIMVEVAGPKLTWHGETMHWEQSRFTPVSSLSRTWHCWLLPPEKWELYKPVHMVFPEEESGLMWPGPCQWLPSCSFSVLLFCTSDLQPSRFCCQHQALGRNLKRRRWDTEKGAQGHCLCFRLGLVLTASSHP